MTSHTCAPDHQGLLADGCKRCAEHAAIPMLLGFDQQKMQDAWDKMIAAEMGDGGVSYATGAEAKACGQLYSLAIWLERYLGIDPWRPLEDVRKAPLLRAGS